ncbi:DNA-directed RNA polymerase subunit beta [Paenibacillus sambharensis]|uniref:DNA-directed RNA polymerase subunit beta n=1 Tax=Paenibacillus sambharensis TaxID=1803190 RepID=A0A2W1LIL2_9BACL|nr:DNA-directed RNA polymerase subunit beta [Paenibacillus sambharensis]PZD97810.1 DNA-directed RNA polymerase subunit beta [Paenibacillus sambharensis]
MTTARTPERDQERVADQAKEGEAAPSSSARPSGIRVVLWLLRKSIVPLLMLAALIGGLYAGYVLLGKGPAEDVWKWETWKHMYDLIFSNE